VPDATGRQEHERIDEKDQTAERRKIASADKILIRASRRRMKHSSTQSDSLSYESIHETLNSSTTRSGKGLMGQLWLRSLLNPASNRAYLRVFIVILICGIAYVDYLTADYLVLFPFMRLP
jgi:hypothetical protein